MIIYRIANSHNQGPWCGGYWPRSKDDARQKALAEDWYRAANNPNPFGDRITENWGVGSNLACACLKEQLPLWWTRRLYRDMRLNGYRLMKLEVPDEYARAGRHQVVYNYNHAKPINRR